MSTFQDDAAHLMRDLQTERKINNLKAENAKLRERIRDAEYEDELYGLRCAIGALRTENVKLRELVADLWEYIHIGTAQDGQSLHDRTRELGVDE